MIRRIIAFVNKGQHNQLFPFLKKLFPLFRICNCYGICMFYKVFDPRRGGKAKDQWGGRRGKGERERVSKELLSQCPSSFAVHDTICFLYID